MPKRQSSNRKGKQSNFAKLSIFQPNKYKFKKTCPLSTKGAPVVGLAKRLEDVYLPGLSNPQNISKTSSSLYLLRKIRDEVHRYSVNFHRLKRTKDLFNSRLNNIKGVGKKTIQIIWDNYDSLQNLKSDKIKNIQDKTGFTEKLINNIINNLK